MASLTATMPPTTTSSTEHTVVISSNGNEHRNNNKNNNNIINNNNNDINKSNNSSNRNYKNNVNNAMEIEMHKVGPITDIKEIANGNMKPTTPTMKSKTENGLQCSTSLIMRKEEKSCLEHLENNNLKIIKGTHEISLTGRISRQKKVEQVIKNERGEFSTNRFNRSINKTDANAENDINLDIKTCLVNVKPNTCNGGSIINRSSEIADETDVKDSATSTADVLEQSVIRSDKASTTSPSKVVTTHIRPTTLTTSTTGNSYPVATQTSPAANSTPKTPNSAPLLAQSSAHIVNNIGRKQHTLPRISSTKLTPKTPPVTPDSPATYLDDDLDSMYSFATTTSGRSTMSCEHSYVAHNGTTFSGRKNKFVIHNSQYAGLVGTAYVTPTQRAQNQIRKLKALLHAMQIDLNQKNDEILKLTREVAELRLFKASLNSPEELNSASSEAVTVREAELQTSQDVSPIVDMVDDTTKSSPRHIVNANHNQGYQNYLEQQQSVMQLSSEMQSSFADSGHFEDMTSYSVHSKDTHDGSEEDAGAHGNDVASAVAAAEREVEVQRQELIRMYEQRIEELIRNQDVASNEMKRIHNDKIEALLQKLSECNTRYADIVPDYELAKERIRELEGQLEDLQRKLFENEDKQNKMYLHMYQKGQEAERLARADQTLELAHRAPNHVSINELLHQLQSTQDELENIRAAEYKNECGSNHALLTAKEAISLWVLGARKTIYRRLLEAQKNHAHVDPEVTLQFLKSAVYYFLTDKENSQGHLQAIESILEFTEAEKLNINKARAAK